MRGEIEQDNREGGQRMKERKKKSITIPQLCLIQGERKVIRYSLLWKNTVESVYSIPQTETSLTLPI